ncbi:MAG: hypothetical protein HY673_03805 [Chloroflexi bacterium]|nr:hypothetical protein [Chloroflexota bacterium]
MPSLKAFFKNLSAPAPIAKKLRLALGNTAIKIARRQSCCGHFGEPGC